MKTRKDYSDKKITHHEYYSQFATEYIIQTVRASFGINKLKEAYEEDKHLNSIKLESWDALAYSCCQNNHSLFVLLKEANESYTKATGVCILKAAARIAIENE